MKRNSPYQRLTLKDYLLRISVLLVATVVVTFFLPREKKFGFEFSLNKPWNHQQIIADYDFPIYKSDEVLKTERDSVSKLFQPYYSVDAKVKETQINHFIDDINAGRINGMNKKLVPLIVKRLNEIYRIGIVRAEEMRSMNDSDITSIRLINGTEAKSLRLGEVFSTRTAYGYLMNADTTLINPELLASFNLNNYIEPNLTYDRTRSLSAKRDLMETVTDSYGMVQRGQKIIDHGEIVNTQAYNILVSLERESQMRNLPTKGLSEILLGQFILVGILFSLFIIYLALYRRDYFDTYNSLILMLSLMVLFPVAVSLLPSASKTIMFLVPFAMIGIFIRIFTDTRTSCVALATSVCLASLALDDPFEFILVNFMAGLAAIYSLHELQQRSQLFRTAVIATAVSLLTAFAFDLLQGTELNNLDKSLYIYLIICGLFLLVAYPLLFVVEKTFGFTSSVTLVELSNVNNPLLRRLSKEAAGTFNHSMQVANLASEVAAKIGAKTLLVRTGALYHDIGKLINPTFFTENQSGKNPHDSMEPERSAAVIISHVTEGLKLAEKYHLPKDVRAFITTHHGRSKAKYFYITYRNLHPDEEVNEALFTYPGPNPFTREQAILMMTDSVEAASRSMKEFTEESISELVNRIIDTQMSEGYFLNCPITFKDISTAKEVLIENLKTIYHTRIQYPELKTDDVKDVSAYPRNFGGLFSGSFRRDKES